MPFFTRLLAALFPSRKSGGAPSEGGVFSSAGKRETLTAIDDLTRLLARDPDAPDAVDITLALGNLFRARGDIDRAVALREGLLTRPGLSSFFQARIHFELGCDYRRAGLLDRALYEYKEARRLGHDESAVRAELAQLHADSGDFAAAAAVHAEMRNPMAEAHYLVRQAEDVSGQGQDDAALRLLKKALAVFPGSPEAWLALCSMALLAGDGEKLREYLTKGLAATQSSARLLLLEGLYALRRNASAEEISFSSRSVLVETLAHALDPAKADLVSCYYTGLFLQMENRQEEAEQWFTKAYVLQPGFWAARLALLDLAARRQAVPPDLRRHIDFFTEQGAVSKRFICPSCGMRGDQIFSVCPRCRAWHSVTFRLSLN